MVADQRTIARKLQLSTATVCRSLKNDPAIHPDTRAKVVAMADKLGYRVPRTRAERLVAAGKAEVDVTHLGVVVVSSSSPQSRHHVVWNRVLFGMSQAASSLRAALHIAYAGERGEVATLEAVDKLPMVADRMVSGMVLLGQFAPDALDRLSRDFRCVSLVQHDRALAIDRVNHDDMDAVARLVGHLQDAGHERIGFATCDSIHRRSYVRARFGGYVAAMAERGLPYDPANCIGITTPVSTVEAAADDVERARARGVTAWVCIHDGLGYDLMRRLIDRGIRVPDDVALSGFDDFDPPAGLPKLTSMNAPFESMGMAAVHRLLHRVKHPASDPVQIMFPAELVEGGSTRRGAPAR